MNENEKIEIVFYKDNKGIKCPLQTKSEAIEKMARAICKAEDDDSGCSLYCDDKCECKNLKYSQLAKAALKALLEVE